MPRSASSRSRTSTTTSQIATLGYRSCLTRNGIKFAYDFDTDESTWFKQGNEDSWEALILQQNRTVILHTKYLEIVGRQSNIQFSDSSQQDDQLVSHAIRLVRKVRTMATERENGGWKRFIEIELFHHYDYFDIFSSSQDAQWSYDPWPEALARQQLVSPKPGFAFGLRVEDGSDLHDIARQVPELTYPHVSPSCIPSDPLEIAFPFLILESKSLQGDPMSCNNQLANGVVKALDIIASLDLQHKLFVIGICQVGFAYEVYLAFSSDEVPRVGVPRKYSIELLATGDLRALEDMIRLLRVLDAARSYGQRTFSNCIVAKMQELICR